MPKKTKAPRKQRRKMDVHFSSQKQDWETPQAFFDQQSADHGPFDLDVCALPHNAKCQNFFTPEADGLTQPWHGTCWCNPPYNNAKAWIAKAHAEVTAGNARKVVCLIPARPGNRMWHDIIFPHAIVQWVKGRIKFVGADASAPFDSALVIFKSKEITA